MRVLVVTNMWPSAKTPTLGVFVAEQVEALIGFLLQRVYRHPTVEMMCDKGRRLLRELFEHFLAHPEHLPRRIQAQREAVGAADDERLGAGFVLDFVAGITDRHVVELHDQVFNPRASLLPYID